LFSRDNHAARSEAANAKGKTMLGKILGALLILGLSTTASMAVPIFDGTVTYTSGATCDAVGTSWPAIYRPQIGTTAAESGLIINSYRSGFGFVRGNDGQFNGTGPFALVYVTPFATLVNRVGTFHLTQNPATVGNSTQQITLSGDFTSTSGCKHVFKSIFLRRPGT
jgi:hypothetical protein